MKRLVPALLLVLAGCAKPAPTAPGIDGAWVRLAAVPGRPGAAYFTLHGGPVATRLVKVESERVATIELHESMKGMSGMMSMRPLAGVDLPAGGTVAFAPGGNHAMLLGIRPEVKPGDTLPLAFRLADGNRLVASAKVIGAGDEPPLP